MTRDEATAWVMRALLSEDIVYPFGLGDSRMLWRGKINDGRYFITNRYKSATQRIGEMYKTADSFDQAVNLLMEMANDKRRSRDVGDASDAGGEGHCSVSVR